MPVVWGNGWFKWLLTLSDLLHLLVVLHGDLLLSVCCVFGRGRVGGRGIGGVVLQREGEPSLRRTAVVQVQTRKIQEPVGGQRASEIESSSTGRK